MIFHLAETTLRSAFRNITFDFSHTFEAYVPHAHGRLARRQDDPTSVTTTESTQATLRPTPTASEPPPDSIRTGDLGFDSLNSTFTLPGNKSLPFDLGCRNCTGTGQLTLKITNFAFNNIFTTDDDDLVYSGAVEVDLTGFALSIGLKATPKDDYKKTIPILEKLVIGVEVRIVLANSTSLRG